MKNVNKLLFSVVTILFLLSLFIFSNLFILYKEKALGGCTSEIIPNYVNGQSLYPLVNDSQEIKILKSYYDCNSVEREDLVIYNFSGNEDYIIKIVKAIPGDTWEITRSENENYNIMINDEILYNSKGEAYAFSQQSIKMLEIYALNYPIIPNETYLIMGNKKEGSLDSSAFGLVSKEDIVGKAKI